MRLRKKGKMKKKTEDHKTASICKSVETACPDTVNFYY